MDSYKLDNNTKSYGLSTENHRLALLPNNPMFHKTTIYPNFDKVGTTGQIAYIDIQVLDVDIVLLINHSSPQIINQ